MIRKPPPSMLEQAASDFIRSRRGRPAARPQPSAARAVERVLKPRFPAPFAPGRERLMGAMLLLISVALFLPIPLSAWGPAISILICAFGLIEEDGVVLLAGFIGKAIPPKAGGTPYVKER